MAEEKRSKASASIARARIRSLAVQRQLFLSLLPATLSEATSALCLAIRTEH